MMNRWIICLLLSIATCPLWAQGIPGWVTGRPVSGLNFVGIGMAQKAESNYVELAKQRALADLVSGIKVEVAGNSLLHTLDDGKAVQTVFSETIRTSVKEQVERIRLVDSWQSDSEYWVYYELNKFDYDEYMAERRDKAIKSGFGYWYKGQSALQQGNIGAAIELFSKGLEEIQPAINQDLSCTYEGKTVDVGQELYASLLGSFSGISIATSVSSLSGMPFQKLNLPITVRVTRNGIGLRNLKLSANYVSGSGNLTEVPATDANGNTSFSLTNITSKQENQQIRVSIDDSFMGVFAKGMMAPIISRLKGALPEAMVSVSLGQTKIKAYIQVKKNGISSLEKAVKSILANNYFDIVESRSEADVMVALNTEFETGVKVPGELYDMMECFSSVSVQLMNNRTKSVLLDYSVNRLRSLVPGNKSVAQAKEMATRELMKRIQREFNTELKKIHIDTAGDIPSYTEPESVPEKIIVTVPVIVPVPTPVPVRRQEQKPEPEPLPENPRSVPAISAELDLGIYVEYVGMRALGDDTTLLFFQIKNATDEDYRVILYSHNILCVDNNGEEVDIKNMKLGSSKHGYHVESTVVPAVATQLQVEVKRVASVALFSVKVGNRIAKLRNLK